MAVMPGEYSVVGPRRIGKGLDFGAFSAGEPVSNLLENAVKSYDCWFRRIAVI